MATALLVALAPTPLPLVLQATAHCVLQAATLLAQVWLATAHCVGWAPTLLALALRLLEDAPRVVQAPTSQAMVQPCALHVLQGPTLPAWQLQAVACAALACTPLHQEPLLWPPARTAWLAPSSQVLAWEVPAHSVAAGCTPLQRGHHLQPPVFRVQLEHTLLLQGLHCAAHVLLAAGSN